MEGFRQCHIRDGAALVRYFAWLEEVLKRGEQWSEYDAAEELEKYRACVTRRSEAVKLTDVGKCWASKDCLSILFRPLGQMLVSLRIPLLADNSAVIHYSAPKEGSAIIDINQIYLCDSGAQYLDGRW
jgi:Xaa-Pro aminopeptidase